MIITQKLFYRRPYTVLLFFLLKILRYLPRSAQRFFLKKPAHSFSVVTAVYNAAAFLDAYFASLLFQTIDSERHLEILCIDDGSTDASRAVIHAWMRRFPNTIRYIYKDNSGPASARNIGIALATAEWVTFIDADDFVHPAYFSRVDAALSGTKDRCIGMASCNYLMYNETKKMYQDSHPLSYKFARGNRRIPADATENFVQVVTNSAFFRRSVLLAHNIHQKEDIRPTFEDGEMVIRYVLAIPKMSIALLADAEYYHRLHPAPVSVTGKAQADPGHFTTSLHLGCLRLFQELQEKQAGIPHFAQLTILHNLSRYYKQIFNAAPCLDALPPAHKRAFHHLLGEILAFISPATIEESDFPDMPGYFIPLLLSEYKQRAPSRTRINIHDYDASRREMLVSAYAMQPEFSLSFSTEHGPLVPEQQKIVLHTVGEKWKVYEYLAWLSLPDAALTLEARTAQAKGSAPCRFMRGTTVLGNPIRIHQVVEALQYPDAPCPTWDQRLFRHLAFSAPVRNIFGRAWLLMDCDTHAGNNAEHLYQHIMRHFPEQKIYFVLRRSSADWKRLAAQGFALLPHGTWRHFFALLNCQWVLASHGDHALINCLPAVHKPLARFKFACLAHGMATRSMLPRRLNSGVVRLLFTNSKKASALLTGDMTPYRLTAKEVRVLGTARYNAASCRLIIDAVRIA